MSTVFIFLNPLAPHTHTRASACTHTHHARTCARTHTHTKGMFSQSIAHFPWDTLCVCVCARARNTTFRTPIIVQICLLLCMPLLHPQFKFLWACNCGAKLLSLHYNVEVLYELVLQLDGCSSFVCYRMNHSRHICLKPFLTFLAF